MWNIKRPKPPEVLEVDGLTPRALCELVDHEGIVLEWYLDSVGVGTWGPGITDKSGHKVGRYRDNPQPLEHVLGVFLWLVRRVYLPDVIAAFNRPLKEHELAAALSFHYNTGAIKTATWVKQVNEGRDDLAYQSIMNWCNPREIIPRRKAERELFFKGTWSSDGLVTVWKVRKPSYTPGGATVMPIMPAMIEAMRRAKEGEG